MTRRAFAVALTAHVAQVSVAATAVATGADSPLWLVAVIGLALVVLAAQFGGTR